MGLDTSEYDRKASGVVESGKSMAGSIGSAVKKAAKVAAVGITAAAGAITTITTMATKHYAEYEQLVGGVDTLFKDASSKVQQNAAMAYRTAGLSANEYMETVTSFSASLIQSLSGDTQKAADIADLALVDMADNANKMGTDMSMIQNAYNGFAKQNYTMLDNLKLGYGGTKTEMKRLIDDANKVRRANGQMAELSMDSFSDVVEAIHTMQEEMDIAGATAAEASSTIEGSVGAAKSAFHNLVTGFGTDNADLAVLTKRFVDSVVTAAGNIIPRIKIVLSGLKEAGMDMLPYLAEGLKEAVEKGPDLVDAGFQILDKILTSLTDGNPGAIFDGMAKLLTLFAEKLQENGPTLFDKAKDLLIELIDGFVDSAPDMVIAAIEIIAELGSGLIEALPDILAKIPEWVQKMADEFSKPENQQRMLAAGKKLGQALLEGFISLVSPISKFGPAISNKVQGLSDAIANGTYTGPDIRNPVKAKWDWSSMSFQATGGDYIARGKRIYHGEHNRVDGSHALGLDYVPFDGYIAELHKGEQVLTADEAAHGAGVTVVQNIYSEAKTPADLMEEAYMMQERAVFMGV